MTHSQFTTELSELIRPVEYDADPAKRALDVYRDTVAYPRPLLICIGCGKNKLPGRHKAQELYTSPLFAKRFQAARKVAQHRERQSRHTRVIIVSAKFGVLLPNDEIDSYDVRLGTKKAERESWGEATGDQVMKLIYAHFSDASEVRIDLHMGQDYAAPLEALAFRHLRPSAGNHVVKVYTPTEGLGIGKQQRFYKVQLETQDAFAA